MRRWAMTCVLAALSVAPAWSNDKWEFGLAGGDDSADTPNALVHGRTQAHDLEGSGSPPDEDWFRIGVRARQSYEVRVSGSTVVVSVPGGGICQAGFCASFARVDAGGTVIEAAAASETDVRATAIRWTAAADGVEYVRVRGGAVAWGPNDEYTIDLANTTLFVPRFNNSANQVTILILQNTTPLPVIGSVDFRDASGALLLGHPLSLLPRGTAVINTGALPAVSGQSGSVSVAHDGTYGALNGKAVALEPATGFTFDTMAAPVPR